MQSNPNRSGRKLSTFWVRSFKRKVPGIGWIVVPCPCCGMGEAKRRHWQRKLSKVVTLRTHRKGAL